jgi:hypothetical protein
MLWGGGNCIDTFDGTSFAAPHTAGTAGLMISYIKNIVGPPNIIDPEDIEEIKQMAATDLSVSPNGPGWDPLTGYGRLNAGEAMSRIKFPDFQIKHYSATKSVSTAVLSASNEVTCIRSNLYGTPTGTYLVDRYEITAITSHTIPAGYTMIGAWERDGASNMPGIVSGTSCANCGSLIYLPTHHIPNAPDVTATITASGATLTSYWYGVHLLPSPNPVISYPQVNLQMSGIANFEYSLYLKQTNSIKENNLRESSIIIYPNPASNSLFLVSKDKEITKVAVRIYDVIGREVKTLSKIDLSDYVRIDISELINGVYFVNLTNGGTKVVKKIIVNR